MIEFQHKRGGGRIVGHKGGKGGGGSARQPVEAPDSLHSTAFAKVLDLISEGPIVGPVHGLGSMGRDVYLDGTPVQNENGTLNFDGVKLDFRAGTQDQSYIQGFPAAEAGQAVGVEVRDDTPWTQFISDTALSAVRVTVGFQGLSRANSENGDINGYRIAYVIEVSTDGGPYQVAINTAVSGKTTQLYERSHRVDLPDASTGWTVRVRRITPNQNSSLISDTMLVQSYTTIVDAKLKYPMSAIFGVQVDASQFRSVPQRAYHVRLRIISVPTNYNPETRQYSGTWDGTFKQAWTDNPAWIFYDLVSNTRYGAGERLTPQALSMLKWSLYPIAQYCDELVPDGLGGTEPRFRCNVYIQEDEDAARVLADLAGVFQGMVYESSGAIMASADMPSSWSYTYTNGNVRDGVFRYSGTPRRTRYTVAQVTYNDMTNFGRAKVEVYEDREAINRYGVRILQLTAFGCTSRAQAIRVGKWAIISSRTQTDAVTFQTGLEHAVVSPGSIIRVADVYRAGRRIGGRIAAVVSDSVIVLDRTVDVRTGDRLVVNLPSGVSEARTVLEADSELLTADMTLYSADTTLISADEVANAVAVITVTVDSPYSELPEVESVWTIESEELTNRLFRVQSVSLKDGLYAEISAIEHNPSKYDAIDLGTKIEQPPITVIPPSVMPTPENVTVTSFSVVVQGISRDNARIEWDAVEDAIAYHVQWRRDESDWIEGGRVGSTSLELENVKRGDYVARVRAINAAGIPSGWGYSALTQVEGNLLPPPALNALIPTSIVFGIRLRWGFPAAVSPIEKTEIWYSTNNNRSTAVLLGDFAYPQSQTELMGLGAGQQLYFWGRVVDKNGEIGPWYPLSSTGGVLGTSSSDAEAITDYLAGQIKKTHLADELLEPIDEIPQLADDILNEKLEREAAIEAEQLTRQTADESLALQIATLSAGSGTQFDSAKIWYFDNSLDGWTGAGGDGNATIEDGWVRPPDGTDTRIVSPSGLGVDSFSYRFVKTRIKRVGAPVWEGSLYWRHPGGGFGPSTRHQIPEPDFDANGIATIDWDNIPWTADAIEQIRLDMTGEQDAGNYFLIDWVAIGRPTPGASVALVQQESQARINADAAEALQRETLATQMRGGYTGEDIDQVTQGLLYSERVARSDADSSLAQEISTVAATANDASAAVQTTAEALASLDGDLSAMYTIKTQITSGGVPYMAGIGVGVENTDGILTSQILLSASRVAVLDESSGQTAVPFVVQGGQVFINQAFIGESWIDTAHIANAAITSAKIQNAAITTAKIEDATITTAKIGLAQIDTLRLASGSVVAGTSSPISRNLGEGSGQGNIASMTLNLPYGGTALVLLRVTVSSGSWPTRKPGVVVGFRGSVILNKTVDYDGSGTVVIESYSYISSPLPSGNHTLNVDGIRPINGTAQYRGQIAILGFQR